MSDTPSLFELASAEIIAFHRFFVAWYDAATADSVDFGRCEQVFAPEFHMIPPTGRIYDRTETIEFIRANRASFNGDFAIDIENIHTFWQDDEMILLTYVEKQDRRGEKTARQASAYFIRHSSAPNGVQWRYLHESWMQAGGN
jgi:hypothetical protein